VTRAAGGSRDCPAPGGYTRTVHRTRIKICGVCRPEDALLAARAGADAIGIVFHEPAPRNVPPDRARDILAALPPFVTPVGVFAGAPAATVLATARQLGLRHVQLNGHEPPETVGALHPLSVVKAIPVDRERLAETLTSWRQAIASLALANLAGFVLETAGTGQAGGSGVANDWDAVRAALDAGEFEGLPAFVAAGGLTPESVGAVVRRVRPYAVDVSSGVEESRGRKSAERVAAFVRAVREADASL
jgi:phosphoribosylanthranilate isomerase